MKKNYEFSGEIIDYTHDGLGVIKLDGFPFFVEDVIVGEIVKVKITKINKNLGYAKLIEIIKKSPHRVEVIEKTSGANLLHIAYDEQLRFKTEKVKNIINKTVGKDKITVLDTIGMENPVNYRNKSILPVQKIKNQLKMGYYKPRTHEVIDSNNCSIQYEEHNVLTKEIKKIIEKLDLSIYDENSHKGAIRHIMIRTNSNKTEIMIGIIVKEKFEKIKTFVSEIAKLDKRIKSIILNINEKKTNVIFGNKTEVLYGNSYITDVIDDIKFKISLKSFYQVNPIQMKMLYKKAIELANLSSENVVIDAYCGIGTISLFLAKKVKKVYGIEVVKEAIYNAIENSNINGINNAEFLLGKSEELIKELISKEEQIDAIIVDPPRKGCEAQFLEDISKNNIKKIVYVSCNPATLARDIALLEKFDYITKEIQPVDMFPSTHHVECVALLVRK